MLMVISFAARSLLGFGDNAAKVDKDLVALINQFEQSFVVFFQPETEAKQNFVTKVEYDYNGRSNKIIPTLSPFSGIVQCFDKLDEFISKKKKT